MTPLFELCQRYVGEVHEVAGPVADHFIAWCHESCPVAGGDVSDEIPWCSSFLNRMAWQLRLPRSKSRAARSWLTVGMAVRPAEAQVGDVVVLMRGKGPQPDATVLNAAGHVGLYAGKGTTFNTIVLLSANDNNGVTVREFDEQRILGVRRLT